MAAACHLNNSEEKPGNLFESICPDETTCGLQGALGLKPKPAGHGEPQSSSRRKSDVSSKPVKIKETCISPKQHSSCVGIAQDEGLSSLLASERPRNRKESRQLLSPSVLLFSLFTRNFGQLTLP